MTKIFSIKEAVNFSWEKVKKHLWFFVSVSLIMFVISFIPQIVLKLATYNFYWGVVYIMLSVLCSLLQIIVTIGFIKICLDIVNDKDDKLEIKNLFSNKHLFVKYYLASLLYAFVVVLPMSIVMLLFLISFSLQFGTIVNLVLGILGVISLVLMIIYSVRLSYYQYYIIENSEIVESLKNSYKITKNLVWSIIVLNFVLGLINILGLICLGVGLLITIPITYIANVYVYRKIKEANINNETKKVPATL